MNEVKPFIKQLSTAEKAVEFAEKVGGIVKGNTTVCFLSAYSISKARYDVGSEQYKVYIRLYPAKQEGKPFSRVVYADTSKCAYGIAWEMIKEGVL